MLVCGMCDLSPRLNTPIRDTCYASRFGLLVAGTFDDPLSISYPSTECRSHRLTTLDTSGTLDGYTPDDFDANAVTCTLETTIDNAQTPRCQEECYEQSPTRCVDITTPAVKPGDRAFGDTLLPGSSTHDQSRGEERKSSMDWFRHDGHLKREPSTAIPCTPAKKPMLPASVDNRFEGYNNSPRERLAEGTGQKSEPEVKPSDRGAEYMNVSDSSSMPGPISRWKPYKHKVLLKLRRKQQGNNYDLALFLLIKFGGPDTAAGSSVIRDLSVLECSSLSSCRSKEDFDNYYKKERETLIQMLSKRVAINSLSSSQLSRKLAKLLPPNKWFNHAKLHQKVIGQEKWNPFSIFGSALPYVNMKEIFKKSDLDTEASNQGGSVSRNDGLTSGAISYAQYMGPPTYEQIDRNLENTPGINWSRDPLVLDEVLWYLEATGKYVDKSKQVCVLQKCFCVTPNPQIAFNWNDSRNPAWKNYRGPRASMGQALSPSIYKESMMDYARLQDELQSTAEDTSYISEGLAGQSLSQLEGNSERKDINDSYGATTDSSYRNKATHIRISLRKSVETGAILTPKNRRAKMQQLVYYRNYFKANRIESEET
ncbi:hypothetical protein BgAZ_303280 [Babesia gibsoni]|uniref:Inner centromere protein ARK-binding domain-containing protein n=1 Tax=Babesia gibsoni TaxID=33632 RepID=A0AAD8LSB1_BABGI|nr:hypothetical protein BgAZ_303280 [Babesia gibsoni]